jgi:ribosome-associated protein
LKSELAATARRISELAEDKNAENVVILDVEGICSYADALVICSGRSAPQAKAIADHIAVTRKHDGDPVLGMEGQSQGHWILVDFGDVIVHVFYEPVRAYYDLEGIWPEAKRLEAK